MLLRPVLLGLDVRARAEDDAAAAGEVGAADSLPSADQPAGREVGAFDDLQQLDGRDVGPVNQLDDGGADLGDVLRRDVRRHADGDAGAAVAEQVREAGRQHGRLLARAVVVRHEVHRLVLDVGEQLRGDLGHPRLGVARRGRRVAVHRAEIALALDERVAHDEILRHAREGLVDRRVAVRVIIAVRVADDLRALSGLRARPEVEVVHRDQDAPLRGLQPVAHVRQRPAHDHAHRVREVRILHLLFDQEILDPVASFRRLFFLRQGRSFKMKVVLPKGLTKRFARQRRCPSARAAL